MGKNEITVQTIVQGPIEKVWEYWTAPEHVSGWSFASDDWEAIGKTNDLRVGGSFNTRLQAKDQSAGFDFGGVYTAVKEHQLLEYDLEDGRHVRVEFSEVPDGIQVVETFDAENENPLEMQRTGWQAFLDNFKKYVENN